MFQFISTPVSRHRPGEERAARRAEGLEVRLFRNSNDVPAALWDSLLGPDDLQMSHRFVRLCQEARVENADYWHLMIYQEGELCCVTTLSRMTLYLDLLAGDWPQSLSRTVRRCWPGFLRLPILFDGLPVSFGQPCLKLAPWADARAVLAVIARAMERLARTTSTGLLCLKEFDPAAAGQLEPLRDQGFFRAFSLPSCSLPIVWDSFSGYLESMTAGYRRQLRATLRARQSAGLEVRHLERFATEGEVIFALYQQVIQRARHRLETLNRSFIDRLDTDLGGQSRAIFLERKGQPLAVAIMLFTANVATFLLAGLDYQARREWQVYPNLVAEVVAEAIRRARPGWRWARPPIRSRAGWGRSRCRASSGCVIVAHSERACCGAWRTVLFPEQQRSGRHVFRGDPPGGVR